jgi:hypothetical protein
LTNRLELADKEAKKSKEKSERLKREGNKLIS